MWKNLLVQTRREKRGSIDGVNLFFGALLGANLGSLNGLSINDYAMLIILLAGTVMILRMFTLSERRIYATASLAVYVAVVAAFLIPPDSLDGLPAADRARLGVTLAIWLVTILLVELYPTRDPESPRSGAR